MHCSVDIFAILRCLPRRPFRRIHDTPHGSLRSDASSSEDVGRVIPLLLIASFAWASLASAESPASSPTALTLDLPEMFWRRDSRRQVRKLFETTAQVHESIDEPATLRNSWGLAYADLNRDLPWVLPENRAAANFQLDETEKSGWQSHVAGEVGRAQGVRAKTFQTTSDSRWTIEAVAKRKRGEREFFDSRNTPYDASDDRLASYRPRQDSGGIRVEHRGRWLEGLGAGDFGERDSYAGPRFLGSQQNEFFEADLAIARGRVRPLLFTFLSRSRFRSANPSLASNESRGRKLGMGLDADLDSRHFLKLVAAEEQQTKVDLVQRRGRFQRLESETSVGGIYRGSWGEMRWHSNLGFVRDQARQASKSHVLWGVHADWTSSERNVWGLRAAGARFHRAPKSSMIFGDGALLDGNPELPLEQGWRAALGPWIRIRDARFRIEAFGQESQNSPILVATSPLRARALPLGGVWSRGLVAELNWDFAKRWDLTSSFAWQETLDASALSAQRGQPIPGRPRQQSRTQMRWSPKPWELALEHGYRAQETLDLLGKRPRPTRHRLDLRMAYAKPKWRIGIEGRNLLAKQVRLGFEGLAGDTLLDPILEQREFLLNWELVL